MLHKRVPAGLWPLRSWSCPWSSYCSEVAKKSKALSALAQGPLACHAAARHDYALQVLLVPVPTALQHLPCQAALTLLVTALCQAQPNSAGGLWNSVAAAAAAAVSDSSQVTLRTTDLVGPSVSCLCASGCSTKRQVCSQNIC